MKVLVLIWENSLTMHYQVTWILFQLSGMRSLLIDCRAYSQPLPKYFM